VLDADGTGFVFTTTVVVATDEQLFELVMVTEYVPDIAVVAPGRVGFCAGLLNDEGPDHKYDDILPGDEESVIVAPSQYGPVFEAEATGLVFTTTAVVAVEEQLLAFTTVTV
jgi:hypothetical protein